MMKSIIDERLLNSATRLLSPSGRGRARVGVCAPSDARCSTHLLTSSLKGRGEEIVCVALSLLMCCAISACGGSASNPQRSAALADTRPMPPQPHAGPRTPADARADALVIQVAAKPRDTNGNKFPDLIEVMANLFATPHPMPVHEEGEFVFQIYPGGLIDDPSASPLREWRIAGDDLEAAKIINPLFGPTYQFNLSLLDTGTDRLPLMAADLVAWFQPADGRKAILRREVHTMQIGAGEARP
jgi:hypothetical protein